MNPSQPRPDSEPRPKLVTTTPHVASQQGVWLTTAQSTYLSWMTDVLVYSVVLNLFVEYADTVVIDSYTISLLTAVLLKMILDLLTGLEHRASTYFRAKQTPAATAAGVGVVFAILFFGKFLILEAVDIVFGDRVELGNFVSVTIIAITMIVTRQVSRAVFRRLGATTPTPTVEYQQRW